MPGRLLPPHQTCPLPLLSLRLSSTMIHTQRDWSPCLFFSVYSISLLVTASPTDCDPGLYHTAPHMCCNMYNLQPHFAVARRTYYADYIPLN